MCGIACILSADGRQTVTAEAVQRMNDSLAHRGPDGEGIKLLANRATTLGLGHRRLSIIDLGGGAQPMCNEDGTVWITYNGEVYNHLALREQLTALGHRFRTRCDTEAILHAYEEWGTECVLHLRGMFAFVIWDGGREQLFAARDRLGIKPFYYIISKGSFLCASEAKALIASKWYHPELNMEAIPEFLTFGYLAGDATLFRDVKKLLPGHWLLWKNGEFRISRYWDIPLPAGRDMPRTMDTVVEEFLDLFHESVRLRLMSDVPLGVFLSGGLDSSAIAAVMTQEMSAPVKTFSVGFEADYYSEFNFAREVAAAIGADHHEVVLKPDQAFSSLPRLIWHEDEPIRNASSVALYEVSRLASEHVKVVLTGEGSDELFAGYERYWATLFNLKWGQVYHRLVPDWFHRHCVASTLWRWPLPLSLKKKASHTFLNHSLCPEEIVFDNFYAIFPRRIHERLFAADAWDQLRNSRPYAETLQFYASRGRNGDHLDQLLYTDQKTYLVELLMKQDNMSMAASIESRVPFLDHKMVEFAASVPAEFKLRGFDGKHLVKQAMRKLLPRSILDRKKMGFPVPLRQWFQRGFGGVVRQIALGERAKGRGIFNMPFVGQLLAEHVHGARDHTDALWSVLNFELWMRIFIDQEGWASVGEEMAAASRQQQRQTVSAH
jgi:asparagine synthase (glutamine-hydrolysing)